MSLSEQLAKLRAGVYALDRQVAGLSKETDVRLAQLDSACADVVEAHRVVSNPEPMRTDEGIILHAGRPYDEDRRELYGNLLWASGFALSKFFAWMSNEQSVKGMTVLELGAGMGVVGLTLGKLGACVTCTDCEPVVLAGLQLNVTANAVDANVTVQALDFGDSSTYLAHHHFDFVLAADVIYRSTNGSTLVDTLAAHVPAGSDTQFFLAYEDRCDTPLDFFSLAVIEGFNLEILQDSQGQCAGSAKGQLPNVYDGSHFVAFPNSNVADAIRLARFTPGNTQKIQILRLTRPESSKL